MKESFRRRQVRTLLKWAGHGERMVGNGRQWLTKIESALGVEGRRKRRRQ